MGLFGELFKAVASEVGNSIIESINEFAEQEEAKNSEIEKHKQTFARINLETLREYKKTCSEAERQAIEYVFKEREQIVNEIKNDYNAFVESTYSLSDEELVKYYQKMCDNADSLFGSENREILIKAYQDALMKRPGAMAIYDSEKESEMEYLSYDNLVEITDSTDISDDKIKKQCARHELYSRTSDIERAINETEHLSNSEFMEIFNRVRMDKGRLIGKTAFFSGYDDDVKCCWRYYGESRKTMHKCLENELMENREYILNEFIELYCENEVKEYLNMSTKDLKEIAYNLANKNEEEIQYNSFNGEIIEYDFISVAIILTILKSRNT